MQTLARWFSVLSFSRQGGRRALALASVVLGALLGDAPQSVAAPADAALVVKVPEWVALEIQDEINLACGNPAGTTWEVAQEKFPCANREEGRKRLEALLWGDPSLSAARQGWTEALRTQASFQAFDRSLRRKIRLLLNERCPRGLVAPLQWSRCLSGAWKAHLEGRDPALTTLLKKPRKSKAFSAERAERLLVLWQRQELRLSTLMFACSRLSATAQPTQGYDGCVRPLDRKAALPRSARSKLDGEGLPPGRATRPWVRDPGLKVSESWVDGDCPLALAPYNCLPGGLMSKSGEGPSSLLQAQYQALRPAVLKEFGRTRAEVLATQLQLYAYARFGVGLPQDDWAAIRKELACFAGEGSAESFPARLELKLSAKDHESRVKRQVEEARAGSLRLAEYSGRLAAIEEELLRGRVCGPGEARLPAPSRFRCETLRAEREELKQLEEAAFAYAPYLRIADGARQDQPFWKTFSDPSESDKLPAVWERVLAAQMNAARTEMESACQDPERFALEGLSSERLVRAFMSEAGKEKDRQDLGWVLCAAGGARQAERSSTRLKLNVLLTSATLVSLGGAAVPASATGALARALLASESVADVLTFGVSGGLIAVEHGRLSGQRARFEAGEGNLEEFLEAEEGLSNFYLHAATELSLDALPVGALTYEGIKQFRRLQGPLEVSASRAARAGELRPEPVRAPVVPASVEVPRTAAGRYSAKESHVVIREGLEVLLKRPLPTEVLQKLRPRWKQIERDYARVGRTRRAREFREAQAQVDELRRGASGTVRGDRAGRLGVNPADVATRNWVDASAKVDEWVQAGAPLTLDRFEELNRMLGQGLANNGGEAGRLRDAVNVGAGTTDDFKIYLAAKDVRPALEDFLKWFESRKDKDPPIQLAAQVYQRVVSIHPFMDGNGRTSRLIMDWVLQSHGLPPATLMGEEVNVALFGRHQAFGRLDLSQPPERAVEAVTQGVERSIQMLLGKAPDSVPEWKGGP